MIVANLKIDCDSCLQSLCGRVPTGQCRVLQINHLKSNSCADSECNVMLESYSIIECENTSRRLLAHDAVEIIPDEQCAENLANSLRNRGKTQINITSGLYIINFVRACFDQCIRRIFFLSMTNTITNQIRFHIFKKIRPDRFHPNFNEYYVEQQSFTTIVSYNGSLDLFEAIPADTSVCVKRGDYFGVNISAGLTVTGVASTPGSFSPSIPIDCTGTLSGTAYLIHPFDDLLMYGPLIAVEYMEGE